MASSKKDEESKLNEAIIRLMNENAAHREIIEQAEAVIRKRAPNASGLSLKAAVQTILDDRDKNLNSVHGLRDELKKVLKMLLNNSTEEAKKYLNHFLFKNP